MFSISLYVLAAGLLSLSFLKDKNKTFRAIKKAWSSFENILPMFLAILMIIGIMLSVLSPDLISRLMGESSGWMGMLLAATIGSLTVIPAFVSFPLAAALLEAGAGIRQITVFVSTLLMVGIVTLPLEIKCIGRKAAFLRNALAFILSFCVAAVIGVMW